MRSVGDICGVIREEWLSDWWLGQNRENTTEGELEKRRQCIEEEKKDRASEFTFSRGFERGCGHRKVRLQSSGVRSGEKVISTKRASIAISGSAVNQKKIKLYQNAERIVGM